MIDELKKQMQKQEEEQAKMENQMNKVNADNMELLKEAREYKNLLQDKQLEMSQKDGLLKSLEGKLVYFD